MAVTYAHTQDAGAMRWIPIGIGTVLLVAALTTRLWGLLGGVVVMALVGWQMGSMTVQIADGVLWWGFGPGWISRRIPVDQIVRAEAVRTRLWDGWGLHLTRRHGWLYNVAGWDAVALELKDGRRMAIGTDEPQVLLAALALRPDAR